MGNQAGQVTQPQQGATAASTGAINEQEIVAVQDIIRKLTAAYQQNILGQLEFINSIIISLLCEGHLLVESVPGLAKTRAVRVVAKVLNARFHRVQFTPDLLPSDIVGTQIYNQNTGEFKTEFGPIFTNLLLADEINRAPAKVQSAMLEAMAAGLPMIATDVGGARDVLGDNAHGLLIPAGDAAALAQAMADLLRDTRRCAELADAGCRHVRINFSIVGLSRQLAGLYSAAPAGNEWNRND